MTYTAESARVIVVNTILILTSIVGGYTDARYGKIYNLLTFPVIVIGLAINTSLGGFEGFRLSLLGLAVGVGIQLVPFALGLIKAGDVKFLAAAGALKGPVFVFWGFLYGAALFGVYAIVALAFQGKLKQSMANIKEFFRSWVILKVETGPGEPVTQTWMPWGIALAVGFLLALLLELIFGKLYWILQ